TLSVFGVLVFVGQAWYYMACIINMTNCVEYNEYKRGERNEAVVSTLRPFMAKFADALKYAVVTLVLVASTVYGLSQNISTMEGQKGHFDRFETAQERVDYITQVNACLDDYIIKEDSDIDKINTEINNNYSALAGKQINAEYLHALGDVYIALYDANNEVVYSFKLSDATQADYFILNAHDGACKMLISNATATDKLPEFNAANKNFKESRNLGMRLWLRAGVTVFPVLMLVASLLIQNKKFIIDEDYYDMMLVEIEKRKQANATESVE
ncbi:MAG: MFS transporter, partial [Clostridia bacterium]|nr:MFS transporter [Clostridia bacterium]